jgi:hypothetical protein
MKKAFLKKLSSTALLLALIAQGLLGSPFAAQALFGVSIPSPSQVADQLEKRYNLNLDSIQEQAQNLNVADNKRLNPQVSIVFEPTDPRPGQKIAAKAFPLYFGGAAEQLYYTWYLKRAGCSIDPIPNAAKRALCDENNDDRITVEDWKTAAMREVVLSGYSNEGVDYSLDTDSDGYQARFGGNTKVNTPNHCYFHDNESGTDYEIADGGSDAFECISGQEAVCIVEDQVISSGEIPASTAGNNVESPIFTISGDSSGSGATACFVSGTPICSTDGTVACATGTPRCINKDAQNDCGSTLSSCSVTTQAQADPICRHLFPNAPSETTGDGSFGSDEERFWGTNPSDDSTAENGNKDEANLTGLGQDGFAWNYNSGDQVGVAVEGAALSPTKHDDSSYKIIWAFSKNNCSLDKADGVGSYVKQIKGYQVTFPTANIDLNDCLEQNLVDPTEGGQATNLKLQMITGPENPANDETGDQGGDIITAQAIVDNGQKGLNEQLFEWRIEVSNNIQFNNSLGTVADITDDLLEKGLVKRTKGNALNTIEVELNIPRNATLAGRAFSEYLVGDAGYLRISARVSENYSSGSVRKGRTDAIIPFTSTRTKIIAYKASPVLVGNKMRVELPGNEGIVCQDSRIDRSICRVLQSEIIGLRIDGEGLSNFSWTINRAGLICTSDTISADCAAAEQNEINFFPVSGAVGSSYSVTVTANDVNTGKTITASRLFQVVDPEVAIMSADDQTTFPKFLGQYKDLRGDIGGCPGGICETYSGKVLQGMSGEILKLKAVFIPTFLGNASQTEWEVNNSSVTESTPNNITIDATGALPGRVVNVTLRGLTVQDDNVRRALVDTWGISQLSSVEQRFEESIQVEIVPGANDSVAAAGVGKYLAAIGLYIPTTVLYTLRMLLSGALVLFVATLAFAFLPGEVPVRVKENNF